MEPQTKVVADKKSLNPQEKQRKDRAYWAAKDPSNYLMNLFHENNDEIVFVCYQGVICGKITKNDVFEIIVEGQEEPIHKTQILYFYLPKFRAEIERMVRTDHRIAEEGLKPLVGKDQRLQLNKNFIHNSYQDKDRISVTMRNGDKIHGIIHRYGIFSINLSLPKGIKIIIMNHSLHELNPMDTDMVKIRSSF